MSEATLSRERVGELLSYDPEAGVFTWKEGRPNQVSAGDTAGYTRRDGYMILVVDRKCYLAHRVAWLLAHGKWPAAMIDHIDGNPANNRLSNLREATCAQNMMNMALSPKNTSGVKGVSWDTKYKKYQAYITVAHRKKSLGYFVEKRDAMNARREAEAHYFGEYARAHIAHIDEGDA